MPGVFDMTHITIEKEKLEQILEALDNLLYWDNGKPEYDEAREAITVAKQALEQPVQEPSPGGILFAVEEAINNGDCPFAIEIAFDAYEAERKALAGITAAPKKGQP
jgi:hypothetical protein